jgi:glycosyltransferase involved in cell wall biosynthesis
MCKRKEKIKVLQLVEDFKIGGLERVVENIFNGLSSDKYKTSLWCIAKGGELADELIKRDKDIRILNLRTYHNPLNIVKLTSLIRNQKFHIVHTHGYYASTIGRISAFLARTPIIIAHVHTTYWDFKKRHLRLEKALSWITDSIICCSDAVKEFIVSNEKINLRKTTTIYNGVHCKKKDDKEAVQDLNDQKVVQIVVVASLVENKGHENLLEAFSKIVTKHNNVKLNILGDGPLRFQLTDQAKRLGISDHTDFLGIVYDVQMILRNCDIVVLPSIAREGLGMAIIEGMCLAKAIIASDLGGIPELVENGVNGYLIPPGDPDYLSEKLEVLINNRGLRNRMGSEGRRKFEENFDADTMIKNVEELYDSLLERKHVRKSLQASV